MTVFEPITTCFPKKISPTVNFSYFLGIVGFVKHVPSYIPDLPNTLQLFDIPEKSDKIIFEP